LVIVTAARCHYPAFRQPVQIDLTARSAAGDCAKMDSKVLEFTSNRPALAR
jgi:hypothetical protein